jgi:hypothetical protein
LTTQHATNDWIIPGEKLRDYLRDLRMRLRLSIRRRCSMNQKQSEFQIQTQQSIVVELPILLVSEFSAPRAFAQMPR